MHIPQDELQKFQDGTMNTDEMIHFLEHMEQCDFCLDELLQNEDAASEYAPSYLQDEILKKATYIQTEQGIRDITEDDRERILKMNHTFADNGLRVLGFATRLVEKDHIEVEDENQLIFLGLISLMDPPREESRAAVENCQRAGIIPVMITGDRQGDSTQYCQGTWNLVRTGIECVEWYGARMP